MRETHTMDQPTVLIISDEAEFSGAITARWKRERSTPDFTLMGGDLCRDLNADSFDLAILGAVRAGRLPAAVQVLELTCKPVLLVSEEGQAATWGTRVSTIGKHEGWLDTAVLLGAEILRRCQAVDRARKLKYLQAAANREATLGRYMLDMRHALNNALTSVLGNAELLLLEPGLLSAEPRGQMETIRNMSLRMHEIMQRFSSLEKELKLAEPDPGSEAQPKAHAAASR
jgi:signal transduction histidine kinase